MIKNESLINQRTHYFVTFYKYFLALKNIQQGVIKVLELLQNFQVLLIFKMELSIYHGSSELFSGLKYIYQKV